MSRPEKLNCTTAADVVEMTHVFRWFDEDPSLSVAVLTGAGRKAFSTGADLKEWQRKASAAAGKPGAGPGDVPGAIPLSNRLGKKPVIAAVNGMALGGGCETIMNCDLVVAADTAVFGLVEVKRGVAAYAGVLPRLIRTVGLQRASEMALTGNYFSAQKAMEWGFVNKVVPQHEVIDEALQYAKVIAENSPDSIICTRAGLRQGWETASVVEATAITGRKEWAELQKGENIQEGLKAFKEKRAPVWVPSKL
ncbi:Carnitinyl-CoA dehydratase [Fonsecaea pedrosoi]|nr:Carnitinyl-CoA dehydratase [Fonsecaea pedrosoi]